MSIRAVPKNATFWTNCELSLTAEKYQELNKRHDNETSCTKS